MKSILLGTAVVLTALTGFAQGTVAFYNRNSAGTSHIYAPVAANPGFSQIGNGAGDVPAGTISWAGWEGIGLHGLTGQWGGQTTFPQLLAANGAGQAESSLIPSGQTTTFPTTRPVEVVRWLRRNNFRAELNVGVISSSIL